MNWEKLKEQRCPRSGHKLESGTPFIDEFKCSDPHCMFKISEERFGEIVSSLYKKEDKKYVYNAEQNLEDLNNLVL